VGKLLAWTTVGLIILGTFAVALFSIGKSGIRLIDIGTFVVISLTLIALVFYANDTNRLTRITQSKWERETILAATYGMACQKDKGHPEITAFILNNPSTLLIRAKVWAVSKVY
jgi:hypothetical protein